MVKQNFYKQIIHNRQKAILNLIKQNADSKEIEREMALLVLDTIKAIQVKALSLKESCKCFIEIDYRINRGLENKLSEEFRDLINEAVILDEIGTKYGPDLNLMLKLATKILNRDRKISQSKIRSFITALKPE